MTAARLKNFNTLDNVVHGIMNQYTTDCFYHIYGQKSGQNKKGEFSFLNMFIQSWYIESVKIFKISFE